MMSRSGQWLAPTVDVADRAARPVVAHASDYTGGERTTRHHHVKTQLIHAARGIMIVRTDDAAWLVPPGLALWMPAGMEHQVEAVTDLGLRTLFVERNLAEPIAPECRVVEVPPLVRELVLAAVEIPPDYALDGPDGRLMLVLLDRLARLETAPLGLPMPRDRRLVRVAEALLSDPGDPRDLADWGRSVGASPRTLSRRFAAETGLTFQGWRQRRRLLAALERLAAGEAVTSVAFDLGYRSPSAFVAMFRRQLGTTPGRFLAGRGG